MRCGAERGEDVDGGLQAHLGHAIGLLELARGHGDRSEVGHRGGHDDDVGTARVRHDGTVHLVRGLDTDHLGRGGRRPFAGGHQHDLCAASDRLVRQGVTLLAARAVAQVTNRVDGLTGATGGDQDAQAAQVRVGRLDRIGADARPHGVDDVGRVREPPHADVASREVAARRRHHGDATGHERRDVLLDRRVLPHLGVHRRTDHHRSRGSRAASR